MGLQWKYLQPGLALAVALALGLGTAFRLPRPASLREWIGAAEGASLRQAMVGHNDGGGHGSHESSEPVLLAGLPSLPADTRLRYDGLTDGGALVSPAAYVVTVYSVPTEERRTFGVNSQGCVYQDNRRYSASPEQTEELTALPECIYS